MGWRMDCQWAGAASWTCNSRGHGMDSSPNLRPPGQAAAKPNATRSHLYYLISVTATSPALPGLHHQLPM
jgi:hypothetical protein